MDSGGFQHLMEQILYTKWFGMWIISPDVTWWVNLSICSFGLLSSVKWVEKVGKAAARINSGK